MIKTVNKIIRGTRGGIVAVGVMFGFGYLVSFLINDGEYKKDIVNHELKECFLIVTVADLTHTTRIVGINNNGMQQITELRDNYEVKGVEVIDNNIVVEGIHEFNNFIIPEKCNTPKITLYQDDKTITIKNNNGEDYE